MKGTDVLADAVDGLIALQSGGANIENLLEGGSVLPWSGLVYILQNASTAFEP